MFVFLDELGFEPGIRKERNRFPTDSPNNRFSWILLGENEHIIDFPVGSIEVHPGTSRS